MTETVTGRDFAAEYVAARMASRLAPTLAETHTAEQAAAEILDEADAAGVDLYPRAAELDETARRVCFRLGLAEDLARAETDPATRTAARDEIARRSRPRRDALAAAVAEKCEQCTRGIHDGGPDGICRCCGADSRGC